MQEEGMKWSVAHIFIKKAKTNDDRGEGGAVHTLLLRVIRHQEAFALALLQRARRRRMGAREDREARKIRWAESHEP